MTKSRMAAGRGGEIEGFRWRGLEITRLEQFSDAVFAFALALLVVRRTCRATWTNSTRSCAPSRPSG